MIVNAELLRMINAEYETRRKNAENKARAAEEYADGDPEYVAATNALNSARFDAGKARYEKDEKRLRTQKNALPFTARRGKNALPRSGLKNRTSSPPIPARSAGTADGRKRATVAAVFIRLRKKKRSTRSGSLRRNSPLSTGRDMRIKTDSENFTPK